MNTHDNIIKQTGKIFAHSGYEGVSMSIVAKKSKIAKSVIYHYYKDKDALLKEMFDQTNTKLGKKRSKLHRPDTASDMLKQIVRFQFENAEDVITILKYYAAFRNQFIEKVYGGYVPEKAYLHVEEVLKYGIESGEFHIEDIIKDSKIITHAINGFVIEYYPHVPQGAELDALVQDISQFILRAIVTSSKKRKGGEKNE